MISIKSEEEIEYMKHAGNIAYNILMDLKDIIKEGVTTEEINTFCEDLIKKNNCEASFLGFNGYPKSVCTSINEIIVHGIPNQRKLVDGDIISVDIGVKYKGFHADTAYTYEVGKVSKEKSELVRNTKKALYEGIGIIKEGIKLNEVCKKIESVAVENNYGIVIQLTGHGVGEYLHEDPFIPNYSNEESENITLKSGMTLAIEPMFSLNDNKVLLQNDGWAISTQDKSPAAHFEHTVLVTKDGYKILTGE